MSDRDEGPVRWPPPPFEPGTLPMPAWGVALARGFAMRCPACGRAGVFRGFIAIKPICSHCGVTARPRASGASALLPHDLLGLWVMGTIMFAVAQRWHPRLVPFIVLFVPICVLFELAVIRPVRGLVLAAMLKMNVLRAEEESGSAAMPTPQGITGIARNTPVSSGWRYAPWRETFYPKGLSSRNASTSEGLFRATLSADIRGRE